MSRSRCRAAAATSGGFTLVEMLIGFLLTGLFVATVVTLLRTQSRMYLRGSARIEMTQKARYALGQLERELRVMGAGTAPGQPMLVYADEQAIIFNADLVTNDPDDGVAVYYDPDAPDPQMVGPDSGMLVLPSGAAYPRAWYGPGRSAGRAETMTFEFVLLPGNEHALVRRINALTPDTLVRGLARPGAGFFSYTAVEAGGRQRRLTTPLVHDEPIHGSPGDTARSARTDSLRIIGVAFDVLSKGIDGEQRRMAVRTSIDARNLGLPVHASCGERPVLGGVPTLMPTASPGVRVTWSPAFDEARGEKDVRQYGLYRAQSAAGPWLPLQVVPLADVVTYEFEDTSVEPGETYWYALSATDCTPAESDWATAGPILVPVQNE